MTRDEWRNLKINDLVTITNSKHIYKVVSTGWEDIEEKDYKDDSDYIIEIKDLFDCYEGHFVVRIYQTDILKLNIPEKVIDAAKNYNNPYDFLEGYYYK